MNVRLRPATDADRPLLRAVYADARAPELDLMPWSAAERAAFVDFQFQAQHDYYRRAFPDAAYSVVEVEGEAVGRLYVDRRADEIRILDVALLAAHRGRGIGRRVLADLVEEAEGAGLPLRLYVEPYQRAAFRLLEGLGFETEAGDQPSVLMAWSPPVPAPAGHG